MTKNGLLRIESERQLAAEPIKLQNLRTATGCAHWLSGAMPSLNGRFCTPGWEDDRILCVSYWMKFLSAFQAFITEIEWSFQFRS